MQFKNKKSHFTFLDINECIGEGGGHSCHESTECVNTEGGYQCVCNLETPCVGGKECVCNLETPCVGGKKCVCNKETPCVGGKERKTRWRSLDS